MTTTDFSTTTPENQKPPKNYKNALIGVLIAAFLILAGFFIVDKNKSASTIQQQQTQIEKGIDEKSDIQKSFDASLVRLDSMTNFNSSLQTKNSSLQSQLSESNQVIAKEKTEIRSILNKKNATAEELSKAKMMIADLNSKISGMEQQIAQLTQQNQSLTQDKAALTQDLATSTAANQDLEKKVDVASTLYASQISITPVKDKGDGREKVTTKAKHVDKLLISFVVDNRIVQPGPLDIYVCIIGPDGNTIIADSTVSSTFTTREEGDKKFTSKVTVSLEAAKQKVVEFGFKPSSHFQQGTYLIQIYNNGFKIGEGTRVLKKSGLFS